VSWLFLTVAGLLEIGWPVGLKMAETEGQRLIDGVLAVAFMVGNGFLLWLAQWEIPMGTSYTMWIGFGAAGTFLYGILLYGDAASAAGFSASGSFSPETSLSSLRMGKEQRSCASVVTGRISATTFPARRHRTGPA
jgi:quaternary ammonium compound-resistance protein SugE